MSVIASIQNYLNKMLEQGQMKALLLDRETTGLISLVSSQSQIIAKEVFLVEQIDAPGEKKMKDVQMQHMKAVCFIRPTDSSVQKLAELIKSPKYREYYIFFSNIVREEQLKLLAEADVYDVVKQVQEFYADFYAVNPDLFHVNSFYSQSLYQPDMYWRQMDRDVFNRNCEGIISLLLSQKRKPLIRFARTSELSRIFAAEIQKRLKNETDLFYFQEGPTPALLLILDRRDDPVTPLLTQWTYQAMAHEMFEIKNNRVSLENVPNIKPELKEVVLSCEQDRFFKAEMFSNFGDLGSSVKELVDKYQRELKINQNIQSIADMQRFVDNYPEFRALSGNVSKHVAIMHEMSRQVETRDLLNVSELEQSLAVNQDHSAALEGVLKMMDNPKLNDDDRLRLVILYALRYENQKNDLPTLKSLLRDRATTDRGRKRIHAVDLILQYAGTKVRGGDLFGNKSVLSKFSSVFGGIKGVENVYTQHKPLLFNILDELIKSRLKVITYPYIEGGNEKMQHNEIFVYIVGGITYEEAFTVATFNKNSNGLRIVLGGSCIHNSTSFLKDILSSGPEDEAEEKSQTKSDDFR